MSSVFRAITASGDPVCIRSRRSRAASSGRHRSRWRDGNNKPIQIAELVKGIPRDRYRTVSWREGARGKLSSKFLAYRVHPAERYTKGRPPGEEQWLLCEWQSGETRPRFHFSTLPANLSLKELVRITKLRWRVERDYQDLKGEVGLDHFEGRSWRGFHRHATLCAVAHGFLALRRALPPIQDEVDAAGSAEAAPADLVGANRLVPALRPSIPCAVQRDRSRAMSSDKRSGSTKLPRHRGRCRPRGRDADACLCRLGPVPCCHSRRSGNPNRAEASSVVMRDHR